jgi:hypothetical protein
MGVGVARGMDVRPGVVVAGTVRDVALGSGVGESVAIDSRVGPGGVSAGVKVGMGVRVTGLVAVAAIEVSVGTVVSVVRWVGIGAAGSKADGVQAERIKSSKANGRKADCLFIASIMLLFGQDGIKNGR